MSALIKHGMALPLLASLLGCAPIGGPMGGNPGPGQNVSEADRMFVMAANTWDRNHDGQVTCGEWQAYVIELVATVDKSKDGALSEEEFAKLVQTDRLFATAGFKYWDTNKDGKVTRPEMLEHTNPAFTLLDRDTDCVLTSTELSAARSIQSSPEGGGGPPGGGGPGRGGPGGGSGSSPDMGGGSSSSWPN
ncbi:EF-hand domain-containing protein [Hyphomicrobium sp. NDB2Meth4]|uniref:EF-hand domain-containing protein n=1 Tax=Hyphomicrobium sp. NDB2Meth4 TaxID=1892846 RepID=UPI0015C55EB9|nr:EF-hand domain-containing protein [Hyphomicrobium sp. NDB2Meth4]